MWGVFLYRAMPYTVAGALFLRIHSSLNLTAPTMTNLQYPAFPFHVRHFVAISLDIREDRVHRGEGDG